MGGGIRTSQVNQADQFAQHIAETYKPTDLNFTGHSLGGYLAMTMAGRYRGSATTFNAPSALSDLKGEPEVKAYIARNPDKFNNYIVSNDVVGSIGLDDDNDLGTTVRIGKVTKKYKDGRDPRNWLDNFKSWLYESTHGLDNFHADKQGRILTVDGKVAKKSDDVKVSVKRGIQNTINTLSRAQMSSVFKFQSCEAEIITAGLEELAVFTSQEFEDHARDTYDHVSNLYDRTIHTPPQSIACLSASEITEALANAGITQSSYVDTVEKHFSYALSTSKNIAQNFNTLHQNMIDASGQVTTADFILGDLASGREVQLPHTNP